MDPRTLRRAIVVVAMFLVSAAACRALPAPPRSPLAETSTAVASPETSVVPPLRTATPTVTGVPTEAQVEPAIARATALIAEWLAIPQRDLALVAATAVSWPNSCLGVEYPGMACASVVTPGFRVSLRDPLGAIHTVNLDASAGSARWAGELSAGGTLAAIDHATQTVTLDVSGRPLVLRAVPGTYWVPDLVGASTLGAQVTVGYDPAGSAATAPVAAWVALAP